MRLGELFQNQQEQYIKRTYKFLKIYQIPFLSMKN